MRSCGGPLAAGWQLASPAQPAERLEDRDYKTTARALLGQELAAASLHTCRNRRSTGERAGEACGETLCGHAHHAYRCAVGGGLKRRSVAVERFLERVFEECGFQTARQVHVPQWDRFRWRCTSAACGGHGVSPTPPGSSCGACGGALSVEREEAVLDLEARGADVPRLYVDVTVHHAVPGDSDRLARAAATDGAVNLEAEAAKRARYPDGRTPWRVVPFAVETYGRLGRAALLQLRRLARAQAERLGEDAAGVASTLVVRWACRLSVALQRANAEALQRCLGADAAKGAVDLAAALAG